MTVSKAPIRAVYSFPHALGRPGIGTTAWHEVRGLVDAGIQVTLVCTSVAVPVSGVHRVVETLRMLRRRVPHRVFGSVQRAYDLHDWRAATLLRRLAASEAADVVEVWPRACLRTLRTARRSGVPGLRAVPSPHTESAFQEARKASLSVDVQLPNSHSHAWDDHVLARERAEYAAADLLLVPSEYARRTFLERGFASHQLVMTQYGFDSTRFLPEERAANREEGLRAVFVARGEPNKGLHVALDAWHASGASRQGTFLICGRILPEYQNRLQDRLRHPSVDQRGFVPDVPTLLAGADVLLFPSFTEGSALAVYEAVGVGCVPLVSDAAGALVQHDREGLIHAAGDINTLTEHLRRLDADRDGLQRLRNGCLAMRQHYTWEAAGGRLAAAYSEAVVNRGITRRAFLV